MSAVRTINGGIYEAHQCNLRSVRYEIALRHAEELDRLRAENERLHERLEDNRVFDSAGKRIEVTPGTIPDGIACRDETIRLQDNDNEWLRRALERSQGAEADVANLLLRAERAEAALATAREALQHIAYEPLGSGPEASGAECFADAVEIAKRALAGNETK